MGSFSKKESPYGSYTPIIFIKSDSKYVVLHRNTGTIESICTKLRLREYDISETYTVLKLKELLDGINFESEDLINLTDIQGCKEGLQNYFNNSSYLHLGVLSDIADGREIANLETRVEAIEESGDVGNDVCFLINITFEETVPVEDEQYNYEKYCRNINLKYKVGNKDWMSLKS